MTETTTTPAAASPAATNAPAATESAAAATTPATASAAPAQTGAPAQSAATTAVSEGAAVSEAAAAPEAAINAAAATDTPTEGQTQSGNAPLTSAADFAAQVSLGDGEEFKGVEIDRAAVEAVAPELLKAGVSVEQAGAIARAFARHQIAAQRDAAERQARENAAFIEKGAKEAIDAFGRETIREVSRFAWPFISRSPLFKAMVDGGLGNDPAFIEMCRAAARSSRPDDGRGAATSGGRNSISSDVLALRAALAAAER